MFTEYYTTFKVCGLLSENMLHKVLVIFIILKSEIFRIFSCELPHIERNFITYIKIKLFHNTDVILSLVNSLLQSFWCEWFDFVTFYYIYKLFKKFLRTCAINTCFLSIIWLIYETYIFLLRCKWTLYLFIDRSETRLFMFLSNFLFCSQLSTFTIFIL